MDLETFNQLGKHDAASALLRCCHSLAWVENMVKARPFADSNGLRSTGDEIWQGLGEDAWLEAFAGHPKIGDKKSLAKKFASTADWAGKEQAGCEAAAGDVIDELAKFNKLYEKKFGFIFIICASGLTAEFMLTALKERYDNPREVELQKAAQEQQKITNLRLEKMLA